MKPGSKYYPLYEWLSNCQEDTVTLPITKVETLISTKLPKSAWTQRVWWSNRYKGAFQANAWMDAGYHTTAIDLDKQMITFEVYKPEEAVPPRIERVNGEIVWTQDAIRTLRKHMNMTQVKFAETLGVRRQTISEWENGVYAPDRSTLKHLGLVAEKEAFNPPDPPDLPDPDLPDLPPSEVTAGVADSK